MTEFKIIDYSDWSKNFREIAQKVDNKDKVKGLSNTKEVIEFFREAHKSGYDKESINELFGLNIRSNAVSAKQRVSSDNTGICEIVDYYNSIDDYFKRSEIYYNASDIGYKKMYELEKAINTAFEECEGYGLIKIRRDIFEERTRFDVQKVHDDVQTALESINELQIKLEKAYDDAKGLTDSKAKYEDYKTRLKNIALSTLGESYESFVAKYDLDFTNTITESEAYDPNYANAVVYDKARAYVNQIKKLAREELRNTRTDSGERLLEETTKYSNSSIDMIDFLSDDITTESVMNMESDIMRQAFIEAVQADYIKTGIDDKKTDIKQENGKYYDKENRKYYIVKDGKKYNTDGTQIK